MNEAQRQAMNEHYVRTVVHAALQDLQAAYQACGADSAEYRAQAERSMGFICGSLQEVLSAALAELDRRARDGCPGPTGTD